MTVNSQAIRSEPHTEIGNLLEQNVSTVLERWSRQAAEEQPNAKRVHHAILINHLREFLKTLGQSLGESGVLETSQHCLAALIHGEQRWEVGWSLTEVVRDFQILRLVIIDFLEEVLDRPLGYREVLAIGLALDEAITASVVTYVKGRDEHLRGLEKERAEEAKQVQQRLEIQAAALRNADRRKNEFLAIVAHELRNPLAPIRNAAQIQSLKLPPDPELQWAHQVIERQIHQMTRMVEDLLDVTRITEGKITLQKESVDFITVVARSAEIVKSLVENSRQQLTVSLPTEPLWMEADASRLIQVISNLLINASKYTDEGGQIWLTAERKAEEVILKVRDTGIGIPADFLPNVFAPFVQEKRSLDRAQGGLGIGLALVRNLVELHGGKVHALSAGRGLGSEFIVNLPLSKETPVTNSESARDASPPEVARRRILVVDDDRDSADTLAHLLRLGGHQVDTAHNGQAALEAAKTNVPDIVLLDLGLPGIDGLEVARRLRSDQGLTNAFLVAMTGYGQDEIRRRTLEAGFNAHLVKPLNIDELHAVVNQYRPSFSQLDGWKAPIRFLE
jgi:signal transduction histidine kinase/ActR/RegA family two-component response regulator